MNCLKRSPFFAVFLTVAALNLGCPPLASAKPPKASAKKTAKTDPVLTEFLSAWGKTMTFEADFTQTVEYPAMEETEKSQGHAWVSKPGRLRWDETSTSQKVSQILNGKKLSSITERLRKPGFRTIDVWEDGLSLLDKAAFSFLSEKRPLTESYEITLRKQDGKTAWIVLKTLPKPGAKPAEPLVAEITKPGYVLRALSTESPESRVRIEFNKVLTNNDIPDKIFEWTEDKDKDRVVRH